MALWHLLLSLLVAATPVRGTQATVTPDDAQIVADEAVAAALTLPPGYKRDVVLRAVSRNLRWYGQHDAGVRAARAMTDKGVTEVPPGARPSQPRYVSLREALPTGDRCDAGLWREEGGGEATTSRAREAWARKCLLERDFHWIGLPPVDQVRAVATELPPGETKAGVLAMLIRSYSDANTLRLAASEVDRVRARLPEEARIALEKMLAEQTALYRLGRKADALAAARSARAFEPKAELIRQLITDNDVDAAVLVFNTLGSTPPRYGGDCSQWFSPIGGLDLSQVGSAHSPMPALGVFLDQLPASPLFRLICPAGLPGDLATQYLLAAGRPEAAILRARGEPGQPFLLVDALLQASRARLRVGDRDTARTQATAAAAALPLFDPGDRANRDDANRLAVNMTDPGSGRTSRNFGERDGDTHCRFEVIRLLAASGAIAEADALARKQPAGAMRAVALSAAVAGRAGLRFDDQAPAPDWISAQDL